MQAVRLGVAALLGLAGPGAAQTCPTGQTGGCVVTAFTCMCTDADGVAWNLQELRGEVATTGPSAAGGDWDYRFDLCGDVASETPGCTLDVQVIREDGTDCEMLAGPQDPGRPAVTATADGIALCYEFGTARPKSLTVELVCDESAGDGAPGEVDGDGDAVSVVWQTGAVCPGGVRLSLSLSLSLPLSLSLSV